MLKDKKMVIFIIIFIVLISSLIYLLSNRDYNYKKLLENKNRDIVYNRIDDYRDKVPHININNNLINSINKDIDSMYENYLIFSPDGFKYNYNVSGNILSIIIMADVIHPEKTNYDIIYKSYNIDLKKMKVLTDKEILDKYNITEDKMEYYLYNKFLNYYNDLLDKKFFTEKQCDFETFLENKNVDNLLDDNNYYINNNHLELYKYFNIYTDYKEEKYFDRESFHFIVT
jgi:hypothetical protein